MYSPNTCSNDNDCIDFMKHATSILFFVLISCSFLGCKKKPFDHRNKYFHDYNFSYTYEICDIAEGITESGTAKYEGTISYSKSDPADQMTIHFDTGEKLTVLVDKNGNITLDCGKSIGSFNKHKDCNLTFKTNTCGGNMGFWTKYELTGTKN